MIDEKELMPAKFDDIVTHLLDHKEAYLYLKVSDKFETVILGAKERWTAESIKKLIEQKRLFRRRNKPFKSFQV